MKLFITPNRYSSLIMDETDPIKYRNMNCYNHPGLSIQGQSHTSNIAPKTILTPHTLI